MYNEFRKKRYNFGIVRMYYDNLTMGVEFTSPKTKWVFIKYMISELSTDNSWGITTIDAHYDRGNGLLDITFKDMKSRDDFKVKVRRVKREVNEWTKRYNELKLVSSNETPEGIGKRVFS